ncbi:hypothetical protein B0H14DRAFT_3472877 [Mycena olivaceomarginata]|nr:hypothetical protein B0H14DRAFT_3472877 [Mycena olivaceomarginata]
MRYRLSLSIYTALQHWKGVLGLAALNTHIDDEYGAAISPSGPPCASSLSPTRRALFPSKRSSSVEASFLPPHLVHLIPDTQLPSPTPPAPVPIHVRTPSASLTLMFALQGHPDAICSTVALYLSIDGRERHHTAQPSHCLCRVVHHPSPSRTQRPRPILLATLLSPRRRGRGDEWGVVIGLAIRVSVVRLVSRERHGRRGNI